MNLTSVKALILDMDGVIWKAYHPIGDLPAIFEQLIAKNIRYAFATNNATKSIQEYTEKISGLGIPVSRNQIFTSGKATAMELHRRYPEGGELYIIGEPSFQGMLEEQGFIHGQANALAVVSALDKNISYDKLADATILIRSGVPFIGTNPDKTFPTPRGQVPGAGSIQAAIEAATNQTPEIIGKPAPTMFQQALKYLGVSPDQTIMIGDRLETDIAGAKQAGCITALALSGVSTRQEGENFTPAPDLIVDDLTALVEML